MTIGLNSRSQARERYITARLQALREDWLARLTGRQNDLLPFEAVAQVLKTYEHRQQTELRSIPINKIVGSVGRYRDFTRSFLPRGAIRPDRWANIDLAMGSLEGLPPIEVYQIGDVYFVADGNHRISVARAEGSTEIEGYVTLLPGDPGLQPGDSLDQAIIKAECANFLAQTHLGDDGADLDVDFTRPGGYTRLLEHIYAHHYFMTLEQPEGTTVTFPDATRDWYRRVYLPIIGAIRAHRLMRRFPTRTAADLYVWIASRMPELDRAVDKGAGLDQAAAILEKETRTPFLRAVLNLVGRLAQQPDRSRPFDGPHTY